MKKKSFRLTAIAMGALVIGSPLYGTAMLLNTPDAVAQGFEEDNGATDEEDDEATGEEGDAIPTVPVNPANINTKEHGTLIIHKLKGDHTNGINDGTEQTVAGESYAAHFTLQKLKNLDITKIDDWKAYSKLKPGDVPADQLGDIINAESTAAGPATVNNLDLGFYLVKETKEGAAAGRTTMAPFLVALPMSQPAGEAGPSGWMYTVHTYPKNQELTVKKTVIDKGKNVGDDVTYAIAGDVPAAPAKDDQVLNYYELQDKYDTDELTAKASTVVAKIGDTTLTKDVDYVVQEDTGLLKVVLTKGGLVKLTDAVRHNASVKVTMEFSATLKAVVDGDTVNEGLLVPPTVPADKGGYEGDPNTPPTTPPDTTTPPKSEIITKEGTIKLTKVNGKDDTTKLAGAKFSLFKCEPGKTTLLSEDKVSVGGKTEWVTDNQGAVTIAGVQLEDWYNGAAQTDTFDYCVIETQAPKGYELNPKPISTSLTTSTPEVGGVKYVNAATTVKNFPKNGGFELPVTGEQGTLYIVLGGTALAAAGIFATRRRKNDELAEA